MPSSATKGESMSVSNIAYECVCWCWCSLALLFFYNLLFVYVLSFVSTQSLLLRSPSVLAVQNIFFDLLALLVCLFVCSFLPFVTCLVWTV